MRLLPHLLLALALTWTVARATEQPQPQQPAGDHKPEAKESAPAKKADSKEAKPACRSCGGRCGLSPVCVCEPGTKKKSKTSYSMKCEPVCVPTPRLLHGGGHGHAASCTGGPCDGRCADATVRTKKSLMKTVTEEEVDIVTRKIEYVCCHCTGTDSASTCPSCTTLPPRPGPHRPWWAWLLGH